MGCSGWGCDDKKNLAGYEAEEVKTKRVFKQPVTEDKIHELSFKTFAEQSKRKIRWAVNMYQQWRVNRMKKVLIEKPIRDVDLDFVGSFSEDDMNYVLSRFIREVRKLDNSDFPPNSLREILIMIQMHLQQNGVYWKLLDGEKFVKLRNILDNTMKERTAQGLGVRNSCNIISLEHENHMFECNALGENTPEQLLKTVIYMLGLHLALRGRVEHTSLRRPGFNCQISTKLDEISGKEYLMYEEDPLSKTNQGGLKSKQSRRVVRVYAGSDYRRCPV